LLVSIPGLSRIIFGSRGIKIIRDLGLSTISMRDVWIGIENGQIAAKIAEEIELPLILKGL